MLFLLTWIDLRRCPMLKFPFAYPVAYLGCLQIIFVLSQQNPSKQAVRGYSQRPFLATMNRLAPEGLRKGENIRVIDRAALRIETHKGDMFAKGKDY